MLVHHKCFLHRLKFYTQHAQVAESRTYTTYKVKDQEPFPIPYVFQHAAKHPQGKHVEEYVIDRPRNIVITTMHEYMREQLPPMEIMRAPVMQTQIICQINTILTQCILDDYKDYIDDDDILYYR